VPQVLVLSPTVYNVYINDAPQTPGVYLALFAEDTHLYGMDRKEGFVVRKLQGGRSSTETWCERWNIRINKSKTQEIYSSRSRRPPESHLTLKERNILFVNSVNFLGIIFVKRKLRGDCT
jgi:hypothetical protein